MAQFVLTKSGITDDAAPSGSGYASRTFTVPTTVDDGTGRPAGVLYVRPEIKTAGGLTVTDGLLTVTLWLKVGGASGTWTQVGEAQTVPRGRKIPLYFSGLDIDTPGAVQITAVSGSTPAAGASVEVTCEVGTSQSILARLVAGAGQVDEFLKSGLSTVQTSLLGLLNVLPFGKFNLTRPVLSDGNGVVLQTDQYGNLKVVEQAAPDYEDNANDLAWVLPRACSDSLGAWTVYDSGTTKIGTAGISIKTSPGRVRRLAAQNTSATLTYYLVIVDKASAAANNDPVKAAAKLPPLAATNIPEQIIDVLEGIYCATGIAAAISSTPEKVTLALANDCHVDGLYA